MGGDKALGGVIESLNSGVANEILGARQSITGVKLDNLRNVSCFAFFSECGEQDRGGAAEIDDDRDLNADPQFGDMASKQNTLFCCG